MHIYSCMVVSEVFSIIYSDILKLLLFSITDWKYASLIHFFFFFKLDECIMLLLAFQYSCLCPFTNSGNSVFYCRRTSIPHDHNLKTDLVPTPVITAIIVNSTDFVFVVILLCIVNIANYWFKTMISYSVCLYPKFILHSKFVYLERVQQKSS